MKFDQLSIQEQETATYCHSCGEVCKQEELGECLGCGYSLCGKHGCSARCLCDDEIKLGVSLSGDALTPQTFTSTPISTVDSIIRNLELRLSA